MHALKPVDMLENFCDMCEQQASVCLYPRYYWQTDEKIITHPDAHRLFYVCDDKCERVLMKNLRVGLRLDWMIQPPKR